MSPSTRVVVGTDDRGRPKGEWRTTPGAAPAYGHMEPAYSTTIERRKATPEELAAARAREAEPVHLVAPSRATPPLLVTVDQERDQASRERGGARTAASYRPKPAPPPEEPPVSEAPADIPEDIPEPVAGVTHVPTEAPIWTRETEHVETTLTVLGDAVAAAAEAWLDKLQCDHLADQAGLRWTQARAALDAAYRALAEPPAVVAETDRDHEEAKANLIRALRDAQASAGAPEPIGGGPVRSRTGEGQRPGQAAARDRRAKLVMGAMARRGDDLGAVAADLGMKKNAVAQIVKFARRREAAEAARAARA